MLWVGLLWNHPLSLASIKVSCVSRYCKHHGWMKLAAFMFGIVWDLDFSLQHKLLDSESKKSFRTFIFVTTGFQHCHTNEAARKPINLNSWALASFYYSVEVCYGFPFQQGSFLIRKLSGFIDSFLQIWRLCIAHIKSTVRALCLRTLAWFHT